MVNLSKAEERDKTGRDRHNRRNGWLTTTWPHAGNARLSPKSFWSKTLVKCQLKTGRTHQIRVHLSHHDFLGR